MNDKIIDARSTPLDPAMEVAGEFNGLEPLPMPVEKIKPILEGSKDRPVLDKDNPSILDTKPDFDVNNTLDFLMAYENGDLSDQEILDGFQSLIDNGLVWRLQGHYGRVASALINQGYCNDPHKENRQPIV